MLILSNNSPFPPLQLAEEDGLLCIGGDLSPERLLNAYQHGIFPWYNENEPIQWYSPDPRFVLYPSELKVSSSMRQLLKQDRFDFTVNKDFNGVINHCSKVHRPGQPGTWIHQDIINAFTRMYELGYAQSAEVWEQGKLVGGLYGILLNNVFFGESMFSQVTNASKYAFIKYVRHLQAHGIELIDCQVYTAHLESLGAKMIDRGKFIEQLSHLV